MADINISIIDASQVATQAGFGMILICGTTADHAYKEYDISSDLSSVVTDFAANTEVYKIASAIAAQVPRIEKIVIFGKDLSASATKPADLATALNTLILSNNDWYRVILEDETEALIAAVSTWAESNKKIFYSKFDNTAFTTDFGSKGRTVLMYHSSASERVDAAAAGFAGARIPGSFTFKFKTLEGIMPDALSATILTAIAAKNMNAYTKKYGLSQLTDGKVTNGKYVDQVESRDYVEFTMKQEIFKLLSSADKVPYTDLGIQQIVSAITTALNSSFKAGIIAAATDNTAQFVVNYKTLNQIPTADRQARKLTGITFSYVEAGAIHEVAVTGKVVLAL